MCKNKENNARRERNMRKTYSNKKTIIRTNKNKKIKNYK